MLCPACNNFRPANDSACPWCNAPAASAGSAWGGQNASFASNQDQFGNSWGGPVTSGSDWNSGQIAFPTNSWQDATSSGVQQLAFPGVEPQPAAGDNMFWSQMEEPGESGRNGQSLLPVPYQERPNPNSLVPLPTGFPTLSPNVRAVNSLLPALPDQEAPVYVPPMYTKPRPVIPRYRAISGLISMIVVFALLCGGSVYLAQVTGKLTPLEKFFGFYAPPSIASTGRMLPVPSAQQTPGPGNKVITSVGLGNSIDPQSHLVPIYSNQFNAGQTIYLTCSINTTKPGTIITKWYTNNNFYKELPQPVTDPKTQNQGLFQMIYGQPAEGKVEVYWVDQQGNQQLAATLLFVVEPIAQ